MWDGYIKMEDTHGSVKVELFTNGSFVTHDYQRVTQDGVNKDGVLRGVTPHHTKHYNFRLFFCDGEPPQDAGMFTTRTPPTRTVFGCRFCVSSALGCLFGATCC